MIEMIKHNPPTSPAAIKDFELSRSVELPENYKQFLLDTNGGTPKLTRYPIMGRLASPIECVQVFCGIGVPVPTSELSYALDLYRGGIPEGVVPFAIQDGGDMICFDMRQRTDRVAFWDHRHFWSTGEWREQDLYDVADSFEQFLNLLEPSTG